MQIKTYHERPPIPTRTFDWVALDDNLGEDSPVGHGATEQEAIADLLGQIEKD